MAFLLRMSSDSKTTFPTTGCASTNAVTELYRRLVYAVAVFIVCQTISCFLVRLLECKDIKYGRRHPRSNGRMGWRKLILT